MNARLARPVLAADQGEDAMAVYETRMRLLQAGLRGDAAAFGQAADPHRPGDHRGRLGDGLRALYLTACAADDTWAAYTERRPVTGPQSAADLAASDACAAAETAFAEAADNYVLIGGAGPYVATHHGRPLNRLVDAVVWSRPTS